jgi:lysozyme
MLDGIDVHDGQGDVAWQTVAAKNQFAFVRGAYGDRADGRYRDNYEGCKANHLPVGLYHFFRVTRDPQKQADVMCAVLDNVKFGTGDLSPVLDVEDNPHYDGPWQTADNGKYIDGLRVWLQTVTTAFPKCTPIIYTRASFWSLIGNPAGFDQYPLWVAHYTQNPQPLLPQGWETYAFWQYTASGPAPGVTGGCDLNRFLGDGAALQKMLTP